MIDIAMEMCGQMAEAYAQKEITDKKAVDTGALRNSITHKVIDEPSQATMYVGTNQEYVHCFPFFNLMLFHWLQYIIYPLYPVVKLLSLENLAEKIAEIYSNSDIEDVHNKSKLTNWCFYDLVTAYQPMHVNC